MNDTNLTLFIQQTDVGLPFTTTDIAFVLGTCKGGMQVYGSKPILYSMGVLHFAVACIGISLNLLGISQYYRCGHETQIPAIKKIQITAMFAAIFWSISLTCFVVNWYASCVIGDRSDGYLFSISDIIAAVCLVCGYVCFYVSFGFRVIGSFKDSMFAVSPRLIKAFYTSIILSICFGITVGIAILFRWVLILSILYILGFLSYVIISVTIVKILITKCISFYTLLNNTLAIENAGPNNSRRILAKQLLTLVCKLLVLYTLTFVSSLIVMAFIILAGSVGFCCLYSMEMTVIYFIHRIVYMTDIIVSSICLFLQNDFGEHVYLKYCNRCNNFFYRHIKAFVAKA